MIDKKRFPRRGEVYWVDLDPAKGSETKKQRPALIISNDIGNEVSNLLIVAPITSQVKIVYPFEVKIELLGKPSKALINQCRTIDKMRVSNFISSLTSEEMAKVDIAIKNVFSLD